MVVCLHLEVMTKSAKRTGTYGVTSEASDASFGISDGARTVWLASPDAPTAMAR